MNIATKHDHAEPGERVTTRWNVRVGSSDDDADQREDDDRADEAGRAGDLPVESVNHVFACVKKCPPAPMPMIRAVIWRLRRTSGTSNAMISTEAMTSVHDSIQPTNGCTIRLVNT